MGAGGVSRPQLEPLERQQGFSGGGVGSFLSCLWPLIPLASETLIPSDLFMSLERGEATGNKYALLFP